MRFEEIDWNAFAPDATATLLVVVQNDALLLIRKHRGLGAGKITAPGGHIEAGERPEAAAVRELQEELLITPTGLSRMGELCFQFVSGYALRCYIFAATGFIGTPTRTAEATPLWYAANALPYDEMWADDRIWLPYLLAKTPFFGCCLFDGDHMLGHNIAPR